MSGQVAGATTATTGATTAAVLPHTGSFRLLFVAAIAVCAFGVLTLAVSGVASLKQSRKA